MRDGDLAFLSVEALQRAFRRRTLSPVEVIRAALDRIERFEPRLNAFVHRFDPDAALGAAREAEARWQAGTPAGPLDGVPVTVKDAILAKGWASRRGSRATVSAAPDAEDAPSVARLREAGAIVLGKTTTPETGWKTVTDSPLSGITRNPWDTSRTPGGSSGGSAAALAAGIGHAAVGTDAAGSVRVPCSFCGLVGLKATVGRIPTFPPSAVGPLGHIGPMTHGVGDAALLLGLMSQDDPRDWLALAADGADYRRGLDDGIDGIRIAFSPTLGYARVEPEVAELAAEGARGFAALGAEVEEVEKPFADPTECYRTHFVVGISRAVGRVPAERRHLVDPDLLAMIDRAGPVPLARYLEAQEERVALGRTMRLFHRRHDLLLTPTVAVAPFEAGRLAPEGRDPDDWMAWTPFTYPFNLTGQPAITVPCGFTGSGLPVGLQIVGALRADALVLRAARAYEQSVGGFDRRRPSLEQGNAT